MREIVLYPRNWLYDAGVLGLLRVLEHIKKPFHFFKTQQDKGVIIPLDNLNTQEIFQAWDTISKTSRDQKNKIYGHNYAYYANQNEQLIKSRIEALLNIHKTDLNIPEGDEYVCSMCTRMVKIPSQNAKFLNTGFGSLWFASERTYPNAYWNGKSQDYICPQCEFILTCHHLAFVSLPSKHKIFVRTASFENTYTLNKLVRSTTRYQQSVLKTTPVQYLLTTYRMLNSWSTAGAGDTEIIVVQEQNEDDLKSKYKYKRQRFIVFYNLIHPEVSPMLMNPKITRILTSIGEFSILNLLLERHYHLFRHIALLLIHAAYTQQKADQNSFLKELFYFEKNRKHPLRVARQLIRLYAYSYNIRQQQISIETKRRSL